MMGWAMFVLMGLGALALLAITGFPRRLWMIAATALMLGGAGYAWQGHPTLAGHPIEPQARRGQVDVDLIELRNAMYGRFNFDYQYFVAADAMTRIGAPANAVSVMIGAVRKAPQDGPLWSGLGLALAEHDGNQISAASRLAFERALQLAPKHPGPAFFYGLALVREGRFAEARPYWAKAVELAPEGASYREPLRMRLFLLDRLLESQTAQRSAPAR
jgi:cytochrome c-type biogenesis protein CcmH